MKATTKYNLSKIMRNACLLYTSDAADDLLSRRQRQMCIRDSACLKKAWRNEKLAMLTARIENRPTEQPKATEYRPELLIVPADYYGNSRTYYGD